MDGRFAVLHGLYWLLNNLVADGPVAVFADDVQWADSESLGFLSYLGSSPGRPAGGRIRHCSPG